MRLDDLGLGWQSHLLACRFGAEIVEREDCIVLRSPGNPTYYWGNCLILPEPPCDADVSHWLQRFEEEIASLQPLSGHLAFGVNASDLPHALPSWRAAGVDEFDDLAVLVLEAPQLAPAPAVRDTPTLELRALHLPQGAGGRLRLGARRPPGPLPVRADASGLAPPRPVPRTGALRMPPRLRATGPAAPRDVRRPARRGDRDLSVRRLRAGRTALVPAAQAFARSAMMPDSPPDEEPAPCVLHLSR